MYSQEELELYRELQPVFKEKMGTPIWGDIFYNPLEQEGFIFTGLDKETPPYHRIIKRDGKTASHIGNTDLRLPLPIDPERPERGLVGMLGESFKGLYPPHGGATAGSWKEWSVKIKGDRGYTFFADGATPTLALLRALKWQVEQEKGGK